MIRLEVADYCGECRDFKPDVQEPVRAFGDFDGVVFQSDTIILCGHRHRCERIRRYLEKKLHEERKADTSNEMS